MADFQYTAIASDNLSVAGTIQAQTADDARALLVSFGLFEINLAALDLPAAGNAQAESAIKPEESPSWLPAAPPAPALHSAEDARQLTEHLALLMKSGLPLAPALRATAKELPGHRLSAALDRLAAELESGRSLEDALSADARLLPQPLKQIVLTGASSGKLADVLVRFVDIERSWVDLGRTIRLAVTYPFVLLGLWLLLAIFVVQVIVPSVSKIFRLFNYPSSLPLAQVFLNWLSEGGHFLELLGIVAASFALLFIGAKLVLSPATRSRWIMRIPLFGPAVRWRAIAIWTRWMELLLGLGVPVPRALELAADGAANASVAVDSKRLARDVSLGKQLSDSIQYSRTMPASLEPIIRCGEQTGELAGAFQTAGDMFERRARMRATVLESSLPPIVLIFLALGILILLRAVAISLGPLFFPMITSLG